MKRKIVTDSPDPLKIIGKEYTDPHRFFRGKEGDLLVVTSCLDSFADHGKVMVTFTRRAKPMGSATHPSIRYADRATPEAFAAMVDHEIDTAPIKKMILEKDEDEDDDDLNKIYIAGLGMVSQDEAQEYYEYCWD